jgi:hypothetical protein
MEIKAWDYFQFFFLKKTKICLGTLIYIIKTFSFGKILKFLDM